MGFRGLILSLNSPTGPVSTYKVECRVCEIGIATLVWARTLWGRLLYQMSAFPVLDMRQPLLPEFSETLETAGTGLGLQVSRLGLRFRVWGLGLWV